MTNFSLPDKPLLERHVSLRKPHPLHCVLIGREQYYVCTHLEVHRPGDRFEIFIKRS